MGSLNDSMVRAEKLGRRAAYKTRAALKRSGDRTETGSTRAGITTGLLALNAFREHGEDGMRAVMRGFQAGYNGWTVELPPRTAAAAADEAA